MLRGQHTCHNTGTFCVYLCTITQELHRPNAVPCAPNGKGGVALDQPHIGAVAALLAALTVPNPCYRPSAWPCSLSTDAPSPGYRCRHRFRAALT